MRSSSSLVFAGLLIASTASANPCPKVMIVLDISGSMASTPSGIGSGPSKLDIAKKAINRLLSRYGTRMPFGLTTFSNTLSCFDGIDTLVEPDDGTAAEIASQVSGIAANSSTNTGEAIKTVAADPQMMDSSRPASYILLITDGEPNCPDPDTATDPAYTVSQLKAAADAGIKTFVIGFGQLPPADQAAMNMMAGAGGEPCMTTNCGTKQYYSAESDTSLNDAIDAVSTTIIGEVGGQCDDSCYANGCSGGQICVQGKCSSDPCSGVTCPDGEYCYTNGTSAGMCISACADRCPTGQTCSMGACTPDPCATASCVTGQVCVNGACVTDPCGALSCDSHYLCQDGKCIDDPCAFISCPSGTTCEAGTGQCAGSAAPGSTGGTTGTHRASAGCSYVEVGSAGQVVAPLLGLVLLMMRQRRRRRS